MNSLQDIWTGVLSFLAGELSPTAINTWFSDCSAVDVGDSRLVIHTTTDFKRSIISSRFSETIKKYLSELFSCEFDLLILAGDEMDAYAEEKAGADILPEMDGYTFDRFIVGNSNKYAHAAAVGVAANPGASFNPLFIYGNSGLGKTHLLLAIGNSLHESRPDFKIAYSKGDEFTNQMVQSLRENTQEEFRQKYRNADLFLIDDIQFIAGREYSQEEFFHTFNSLYESGSQIVITSDRPPIEMLKLEDRLRTRFEWGLLVDVGPPDTETRMAIIRNKASQLGMVFSDEVVEYIAENITANIRQIEGVVKRLTAFRELDEVITTTSVKRAIKDVIRLGEYIPTPDVIIDETARYYSLTPEDLRGQRRSKNTAMARQISMYLIRSLTNLSLVDIGKEYENRNHSTVISSINKVEELLKTDPSTVGTVRDITSTVNSRN